MTENAFSESGNSPPICGKPMPQAENGADRGHCALAAGHYHWRASGTHRNGTCSGCGVRLTSNTAGAQQVVYGSGRCRECITIGARTKHGWKPRNWQTEDAPFTFPRCGCTGVLPKRGASNQFAVYRISGNTFSCRIANVLGSSQRSARSGGYKPIASNTPHSVIREMMDESNCWRCDDPLIWSERSQAPALDHDHKTGKIYGFTHSQCNLQSIASKVGRLQDEIERLSLGQVSIFLR